MPSVEHILSDLSTIAHDFTGLAMAWHLAMAMVRERSAPDLRLET